MLAKELHAFDHFAWSYKAKIPCSGNIYKKNILKYNHI